MDELKNAFINKNEFSKELYGVFERYRGEVVQLVNHNRLVTVVWHRHFGPQFVAHFIKNYNDPNHQIPSEINNISLGQLLQVMRNVLTENSSQGLKAALDQYGDKIIEESKNYTDFDTQLSRLSQMDQSIH